jgi:3'-5' exoribonuclease
MSLPNPLYALVVNAEKRTTKSGDKYYWHVMLKTVQGNVSGFMWNAPADAENNQRFPHTGDIVQVSDFVDQMEDRGSIVINKFCRIPKDAIPPESQCITEFEKVSREDLIWAWDIIGDKSCWEDKAHYRFVMDCLKELDKEKLNTCPAASHVHHQYQGGLIIHTAEVVEMCRAIISCCVPRYGFVNKDVLLAGAILHDIGKLETYFINDIGAAQQLPTEKTIGHLFWGMFLVETVARKTNVDRGFVNEIIHCVASHHGDPQYGSIKEIQSIEAGILSKVDYISSRNGTVAQVLKDAVKQHQIIQEEFRVYGENYFLSSGMKRFMTECSI